MLANDVGPLFPIARDLFWDADKTSALCSSRLTWIKTLSAGLNARWMNSWMLVVSIDYINILITQFTDDTAEYVIPFIPTHAPGSIRSSYDSTATLRSPGPRAMALIVIKPSLISGTKDQTISERNILSVRERMIRGLLFKIIRAG